MAEPLSVHLESPVEAIEDDGENVRVAADGLVVEAEYVIVAIPPALAGRISYDPPLPAARDGFTQRAPMGSVIKCVASYPSPFWRERGLSGEVIDADGPVGLVFDDSPPDGTSGALVGFLLADDAREAANRDEVTRRDMVLDRFAAYFGSEAADPVAYMDYVWANDPYSRGCYAGNPPPGALTSYGEAIREPVGRIHWAGTETATRWAGYMDGAISSGRRAAAEVASRRS